MDFPVPDYFNFALDGAGQESEPKSNTDINMEKFKTYKLYILTYEWLNSFSLNETIDRNPSSLKKKKVTDTHGAY